MTRRESLSVPEMEADCPRTARARVPRTPTRANGAEKSDAAGE